uniref:DEP domain-containing protein n=1 Tax=Hucho hucho TaxID=62062 RepID=A0A4W5RPE1_9TELE
MHTAIYIFHLQWNEVAKHFRHFRVYGNCFTAVAAVDWLHELLRNSSNFGPDVTRQQTVQLLKKFLKNHVIEDIHNYFSQENVDPSKQDMETEPAIVLWAVPLLTEEYVQDILNPLLLHVFSLQKTLGLTALEDVLNPRRVNPQNIVYNMTNVNKHGVVTLEDKTGRSLYICTLSTQCRPGPSYPGFERDAFKTKLFVNILGMYTFGKLVSFLMDHLQVPVYLQNAVQDHMAYHRKVQFQRQYPDIYACHFPTTESEAQVFEDKPKITPPLLISMKKPQAFSIRN